MSMSIIVRCDHQDVTRTEFVIKGTACKRLEYLEFEHPEETYDDLVKALKEAGWSLHDNPATGQREYLCATHGTSLPNPIVTEPTEPINVPQEQ